MLEIIYLPINEIKPYGKNARKHGERDIYSIQTSIERFGMNDPIGIWSDKNIIVEGHGRLEACKRLGMREVPCVRLDHLTDEQRREYGIAHNATAELSEWNFEILEKECAELDFDDFEFNFDFPKNEIKSAEQFLQEMKENDFETTEEYEDLIERHSAKLTTDDCYTPPLVYEAVADYAAKKYGLDKRNFVRPFKPNGDYQNENYKSTDIVVDNPPFSIMTEILRFYNEKSIKYFLFVPHLTMLSGASKKCAAIVCGANVIYDNGAVVNTSFLTNLESCAIRSAPKLYQMITEAVKESKTVVELPKYEYPKNLITVSMIDDFSKYGIDFEVEKDECIFVRGLDAQKEVGKAIFGGGFLISDSKKAEREKAERKKAEREKATVWELSERELELIRSLNK